MTDPERILDRPPSELAARLLRAGSEEAPSRRSLQRTLSALGVGATALGAAGSAGALGVAKTVSQVTLVALTKWAGIGALGGVVVATAAHGLSTAGTPAPAAPPSALHASSAPPSLTATPLVRAKSEPAAAAPEPEPPLSAPRAATPVARTAELEAPLAAEVAFVDRGRAAFQRGELAVALTALASYEREFPEPRLLPEVLYLRMEALNRRGERERAAELAARLLRKYPRSPQAARARAVLAER